MADLSQYSFTGRLGADATVKTIPSGKTVLEMSVAVNTGYGDFKKTNWVKVKVWGDRGKNIVDIFKKGAIVAASGEPEISQWTGNDGSTHADLVVTCMTVQLIHSAKKAEGQPQVESSEEEEVQF